MTRISAIFTGKNGSMGFEYGKRYDLEIRPIAEVYHDQICSVMINFGGIKCPYKDIEVFLQNWTAITVITKGLQKKKS